MSKTDKLLIGAAGTFGIGLASCRRFFPHIADDIRIARARRKVYSSVVKSVLADRRIIDMFKEDAVKHPTKTFVICDDNVYSYQFIDDTAKRIAKVVAKWDIHQNDTVAMMIYNETAFVWTFFGLHKLGNAAAFINFHLRAKPLAHSITASEAIVLTVGECN